MARSNFNSFVPRAYAIYPVAQTAANTTGGSAYASPSPAAPLSTNPNASEDSFDPTATPRRVRSPLRGVTAANATRPSTALREACAIRQGYLWSFGVVGGTDGTDLAIDITDVGTTTLLTSTTTLTGSATAALTTPSGVIGGSWRTVGVGGASAVGNTARLTSGTNLRASRLSIAANGGTTAVVTAPGLACIYTAPAYWDPTNDGIVIPGDRPSTHFPGCVKGFYITLPFAAVTVAGSASETVVRTMVVPMDMRVHEVFLVSGQWGQQRRLSQEPHSRRVHHPQRGHRTRHSHR